MAGVSRRHPLFRLLADLTQRNFAGNLGWPDTAVIEYLTEVLVDFVYVDRLYKIRDARGRRVQEVAEMLAEGDLLHRADSVERERAVHKHIGDYTLFMAGVFPEFVRRLQTSKILISADAFLDYIQVGKRSYRIVSEFPSDFPGGPSPLFRKLSENFELCVFGLGYVRADLDRLRDPNFQQAKGHLLG
ncbi:MAG: hypothetical protein A2Z31_08915 [candidate division NC10 bacterium RBG_16_65_8]|nr:MAG: hypothetical protein A2Z31_08915 [candidate division NC10 bacterium RBG_16_65_8]